MDGNSCPAKSTSITTPMISLTFPSFISYLA
jgi:hypothetical protein